MPEHPSDDRLTTTAQRSGFDDDPLSMGSWIGIGEAADLAFLGVYQPADTVLRCMAINKWAVLVRHTDRLANQSADRSQRCFVGLLI